MCSVLCVCVFVYQSAMCSSPTRFFTSYANHVCVLCNHVCSSKSCLQLVLLSRDDCEHSEALAVSNVLCVMCLRVSSDVFDDDNDAGYSVGVHDSARTQRTSQRRRDSHVTVASTYNSRTPCPFRWRPNFSAGCCPRSTAAVDRSRSEIFAAGGDDDNNVRRTSSSSESAAGAEATWSKQRSTADWQRRRSNTELSLRSARRCRQRRIRRPQQYQQRRRAAEIRPRRDGDATQRSIVVGFASAFSDNVVQPAMA